MKKTNFPKKKVSIQKYLNYSSKYWKIIDRSDVNFMLATTFYKQRIRYRHRRNVRKTKMKRFIETTKERHFLRCCEGMSEREGA